MQSSNEYIELEQKYGAHNYKPIPVVISRAQGVWVWDVEGKKYLDCLSSYSAVNHGHVHPRIMNVLMEQSQRVTLTSRAFHNDKLPHFLEKLAKCAQMEAVLPMNTGAEAVETAIKTARKWGYMKKKVKADKAQIIVCDNNFHGRTTTIVGFSSDEVNRKGFGPFTPGFKSIPFGDPEALERVITPDTAAFLVEPIQGEGGVIVPPEGYLKKVRKICTEHNVLLIFDEIQTGLGRTGKLFAHMYEDAKPDILIVGKALGGGVFPVSGIITTWNILDVIGPGEHGSTFGGNPLGSAIASEAIDIILEENLPHRATEMGKYFKEGLKSLESPLIKEIRGKGLLIGVELKREYGGARPYCQRLMEMGVLAKDTHGQTIRFAPPLIISRENIDFILERVKKVLNH